jgi:hypothetical protein
VQSQRSALRSIQPEAYRFVMNSRHLTYGSWLIFAGIRSSERINAPVLGVRFMEIY